MSRTRPIFLVNRMGFAWDLHRLESHGAPGAGELRATWAQGIGLRGFWRFEAMVAEDGR